MYSRDVNSPPPASAATVSSASKEQPAAEQASAGAPPAEKAALEQAALEQAAAEQAAALDQSAAIEEEQVPHPQPNSLKHFNVLMLSEAAAARFDSVELGRFEQMVAHAQRRAWPYVEFKLAPSDPLGWGESIKGSRFMQQLEKDERVMFVWVAGTANESVHTERFHRPHKYCPHYDPQSFESTLGAPFGDPSESERDFDNTLFGTRPSLLMALDGRRPSTYKSFTSLTHKYTKAFSKSLGQPTNFRLMHSNAEFHAHCDRGHRGDAKFALCPEPLESVLMKFSKSYKVAPTNRKYIDLPGSNRTRGLSNIPLHVPSAIELQVSWATRCNILDGCAKGAGTDHNDFEDWLALPEPDDTGDDATDIPSKSLDAEACQVFPWVHLEMLNREWVNMFDPKGIVHLQAGTGNWAIAAARHCRQYVGFCRSKLHVRLCEQAVLAVIVSEMIDGLEDGFRCKRFLSKQRSLAGTTDGEGTEPEQAGGAGNQGLKRARVDQDATAESEAAAVATNSAIGATTSDAVLVSPTSSESEDEQ